MLPAAIEGCRPVKKLLDILFDRSHLTMYLIMIAANAAAIVYGLVSGSAVPYSFLSYALIATYLASCISSWWVRRSAP
jgi:hypothetical protein